MNEQIREVTGAEALMLSLLEEGVDTIFGYPGGAIMPVYDALFSFEDRIKHYLMRHEQGAIHAAQGYARVTGNVGVVFATSGPGATNLITGIADAMIDSTPLVCVTGQVVAALLGTDAFQESDVVGISMPVTKWNIQVRRAADIPAAISKAFFIARTGRPGPVVIDFTKNAQFETMSFEYHKCHRIRSYVPKPDIDKTQIKAAASLINNAKKPFVVVGQGVLLGNAVKEFHTFIEKSGIPFGWTILGATAMPIDHPLNMGMLGMHGKYACNIKTNECDVLIAIGMRFDDRVTSDLKHYAKQAKVIHLEIDPSEIDKNVKADVPLLGDVKSTLPELSHLLEKRQHKEWIETFMPYHKTEEEKVVRKEMYPDASKGINMAEAIRVINEQTKGDAISVTDVGQHQMYASRYVRHTLPRSFVTSGGLGTMGFGLPAAFGAKVALPDKQVILFVGDGGIQMTLQEIATMAQYDIAVKIVLLNNNFLGMVRQWQELFFNKRYSFTPLVNPDFQILADGFRIGHAKVEKHEDLDKAVADMLASDKPYLLEVVVEKEDNVFPMIPAGAPITNVIFEG
jgi:acetolactate synthase I/II/III large subunit